ncbi:hypothetical protein HQ496_01985 [bacterium]|nr:hypothetical protein [bacterium]
MNYLKYVFLGVTLCALTACSSTQPAGSFQKVNELGKSKTATVRLKSGEKFKADLLRVMPDSAYFVHPVTLFPTAVPTSEIDDVTFIKRRKGAFRGVVGVLAASAASIMLGAILPCNSGSNAGGFGIPDCFAAAMVIVPIFTAPFTLPGGLAVGAIVGFKDRYQAEQPLDEK